MEKVQSPELSGIGFGYRPRAPWACDPDRSRGRLIDEPQSATRTPFQRDRDRIIHSTAFRRLKLKTQVFISDDGDHYRTRLTHTIEVAQIARAIARALEADEDLAEAVALCHDFGHTPFGHAGEDALDRLMQPFGGFDHNAQSLRIVTKLERRYAGFDGLNLSWETLDGLVKHNGPLTGPAAQYDGEVPGYFLEFDALFPLKLSEWCGIEGQAAAIADDVAYNTHDIDDGIRAGLFTLEELAEAVPFVAETLAEVRDRWPELEFSRLIHEFQRRQITAMVEDVICGAREVLERERPQNADAIRQRRAQTVGFSPAMRETDRQLKAFLFERMYRSPAIMAFREMADRTVSQLFERYLTDPSSLPSEWRRAAVEAADEARSARIVADFIAGMTDSYARNESKRLFDG
ncbi:deoxyguanosinetriphosphate triphosphohydrolase [Notoacmeibacter sp. MSK16QG-6]|uniref:deoxyguanosinetriphosphate triphosphohydrolase n=1 Tax=Notoacmeibacter sp. MSK16QG-6 TaxID=2957982 RepID=UPI0020A037AD|nr:deoxyguanosinetriphosphate triphosphohydrolase [Notoacmeibacter sp. MSK16QG-6]MCP1199395.1 deoxyguanosinetriphosphate triphosphohydrolase [Notoacmeibacter sp. MSK16QG-6]